MNVVNEEHPEEWWAWDCEQIVLLKFFYWIESETNKRSCLLLLTRPLVAFM